MLGRSHARWQRLPSDYQAHDRAAAAASEHENGAPGTAATMRTLAHMLDKIFRQSE